MIRRTLLLAAMVVVLWGAPASAQSYGDILGEGDEIERVVVTGTSTVEFDGVEGSLAQTGSNDIVPLVQGSIVLIGGGVLLVLVARRRRAARTAAV